MFENPSVPRIWNIALNAWIIQDGNYPDFFLGQIAEFAVEFYQPRETPFAPSSLPISAVPVSDLAYRIVGHTVLHSDLITVLDIGILVYRGISHDTTHFADVPIFETELQLGVDFGSYFENLSKLPDVPALIYTWRIAGILQETGPFIEVESGRGTGQKMRIRDAAQRGYKEISRTDAWNDEKGGCAEYIFRCELLPVSPKLVSATAIA